MLTLTVVATKGGVGKTTLSANLGGLLRDLGLRVLLVDADVQPSLSKYFVLSHLAPAGLTKLVTDGFLSDDCISSVQLPADGSPFKDVEKYPFAPALHLIRSDTREGNLQDWLSQRLDRLVRISMALNDPGVDASYDVVIIDTQGALGHLQDAAVNAADILITPATPDVVSAREFIEGTVKLIDRHEAAANMGFKIPSMKAVINRTENTRDSRSMSELIREAFLTMRGRVSVMQTAIHSAVAFRKAATAQVPVHWIDPGRASDAMHQLLWELIPSLEGRYAPNHRDFGVPLGTSATSAEDAPSTSHQ
ncbi:chromosome partitioning related protein ParA [Variovorax sp. HW608]|uniref:ParA family protein n=1 Tax=Variovorax sp. HW608 TaxID=1034889 RepID=UPI00081F9785|nr:ParA family protein [Variovorax sp. HW608]SCK55764.1 chromosome partitioning related protein ParA [Variovorax sp. HW608]